MSGDSSAVEIRSLRQDDLRSAADLVEQVFAGMPYLTRSLELLHAAATAPDGEHRAAVATAGGIVVGVAVFGLYAGAIGAGRLSLLVISPGDRQQVVGRLLIDEVKKTLGQQHARFILAELASDAPFAPALSALRTARFEPAGVIDDFFRDGVALAFLRAESQETESYEL